MTVADDAAKTGFLTRFQATHDVRRAMRELALDQATFDIWYSQPEFRRAFDRAAGPGAAGLAALADCWSRCSQVLPSGTSMVVDNSAALSNVQAARKYRDLTEFNATALNAQG